MGMMGHLAQPLIALQWAQARTCAATLVNKLKVSRSTVAKRIGGIAKAGLLLGRTALTLRRLPWPNARTNRSARAGSR